MPAAFSHAVTGGWMTHFTDAVVRNGSNRVDVFPSLHVAVSTFILGFDRRYARWRFRAYLAPAIGLWVSTVYLRFHYGVDVLGGFALAAFGLWVAFRVAANDRHPTRSISQ
jgi:membrane-associated phospholipid phosphatase